MDLLQIRRLGIHCMSVLAVSRLIPKINNLSVINGLKHRRAPQHGRLTGTGGPDNTQNFTFIHMNRYIFQDFLPIKAFLNMVHFQ